MTVFELFGNRPEFTADDAARLRRVEAKLDQLLDHLGIEAKDDELPPEARDRAAAGDKIGAIKAYRRATGAGLAESLRAIESYIGRHPGREAPAKPRPAILDDL